MISESSVTFDLSVVLGFVFLIFDGELNPIAGQVHSIPAGILTSETAVKHKRSEQTKTIHIDIQMLQLLQNESFSMPTHLNFHTT